MKKNNTIVMIGAAVLAVLLIVLGSVWSASRPATSAGSKTITVEVVHKDESTKTFTCTTTEEYLAGVLLKLFLYVVKIFKSGIFDSFFSTLYIIYEIMRIYKPIIPKNSINII